MHDVAAIMQALLAVKAKSPNPQMAHADPMAAELGLRDFIHRGNAYILGDFVVLFETGKVWYSDTKFFFEQLFLRFKSDEGTRVDEAILLMESLALGPLGCEAVVVGDTQVGRMAMHYAAAGYVHIGHQLLKG